MALAEGTTWVASGPPVGLAKHQPRVQRDCSGPSEARICEHPVRLHEQPQALAQCRPDAQQDHSAVVAADSAAELAGLDG